MYVSMYVSMTTFESNYIYAVQNLANKNVCVCVDKDSKDMSVHAGFAEYRMKCLFLLLLYYSRFSCDRVQYKGHADLASSEGSIKLVGPALIFGHLTSH